jgi:hypothetical protein
MRGRVRIAAMMMATCCVVACPGAVQAAGGGSGASAPSREAKEEAQRRFEAGKDLYEENDFRGALIEFKRAYQLAPHFKLLYTIAQVHYQLQDYAASLQTFEKYLADGGREIAAARRAEVEKEIERLKTRVAKVEISCNHRGAEVSVDDVEVGTTPLSKPVVVSAGRRRLTVSLKGKTTVSRTVDFAGGDTTSLTIDLQDEEEKAKPAASATTAAPAAPPSRPISKGAWIGWGVTGVLAIGTAITGVMALQSSKDLADKRETPNVGSDGLNDASTKTSALALTTDILGAATLVAGGVSLYLTLKRPSNSVQVGVGPSSVVVVGSF